MVGNTATDAASFFQDQVNELSEKLSEISNREKEIIDAYGADVLIERKVEVKTDVSAVSGGITKMKGETEKERKAREKAERERKKQERAMSAEEKRRMKEQLDAVSATRHQEEAVNLASYTSGQKNFLEYTEAKTAIEEKYIADSLAILEEFGKTDSEKYAKLVEQREKLTQSSAERLRKASLMDVEQTHKGNENDIVTDYFDPNGAVFQNQKALNQRLLEEDLRYLQEKRDLYAEGSDEWFKINSEIEQRLAQDKLAKQQELAAAYLAFEAEFGKSSGSVREKIELAILEELHKNGLISETEYQKAVAKIKQKYREEDRDKNNEIQNEYADMVQNLYYSFKDLFANLGTEGANFWGDLSKVAEASFAVIGAMISQFSAYYDAERDLEVAKIEKRYDQEIAAAGKNQKKVQALEEQKEKEIAKTKSKYNDRAMKLEIAQALAQTAQAAIAAYASAAAIPGTGWIMAPIAAALATAAGMVQVATIRKQHQAEAAGYYTGGFTKRDPDDHKEVGVVHANEFVANHQAVANPALSPILSLIDHAQRTNTIGSLTAEDVSNALGKPSGVSARGGEAATMSSDKAIAESIASLSVVSAANRSAIERLSRQIEDGIISYVVMDGSEGLHQKYVRYQKLLNNPKR